MPNRYTPTCGCSVSLKSSNSRNDLSSSAVDKSKSLNGNEVDVRSRKNDKSKGRYQISRARTADSGSSTLIPQQPRLPKNNTEHKKRSNFSRRSRSAERSESHYVYIDSDDYSSRDEVQVVAYATSPMIQESSANITRNYSALPEVPSRNCQQMYAIPSMTSPPPTYDVAVAKSCQAGLPPSYEDYLCHKYATLSRSHTPPPPWSISSCDPTANSNGHHIYQSQTEIVRDTGNGSNPNMIFKKHVRQQRLRAISRRSSSESRAHQQRLATMCEDGAFCMETTVIQSAFEDGVAFCSLM
ncbi:uncharacterized protein [Fopius arisanus]|uniref:Uncharacterized protein n=1 Tax=Fopius arisanus TaxID=64838 RepID=A0A0C9RPC5_9HYME|nr:PREDICTED: uncharacterized protein LOC105266375 [Fopius arisanus]